MRGMHHNRCAPFCSLPRPSFLLHPGSLGRWLLLCDVHHDYMAGMVAEVEVLAEEGEEGEGGSSGTG